MFLKLGYVSQSAAQDRVRHASLARTKWLGVATCKSNASARLEM